MSNNEEINSLKCIYDHEDVLIFDEKTQTGQFFVKIKTGSKAFQLCFPKENSLNIQVYNLPPVCIDFNLPKNYPSEQAPGFKLNSLWLNEQNITLLTEKFEDLWSHNLHNHILFIWISFVQDEIFEFLRLDPQNLVIENSSASLFIDYDKEQREIDFQKTYYFCNVCFAEKLGRECLKFNICEHVFCKNCMKGYFKSLISDGNVKILRCPQNKCESFATPAQILSVIGSELFERYDSLLLKDALNNMSDIVYCPISNCECAVIVEENNFCMCPKCKYIFCGLCRKNYHGVQKCKNSLVLLDDDEEISSDLENDDIVKKLSHKYGEKIVRDAIEERETMKFIKSTSRQCPACNCWLQKLDGCNKMICMKCHKYFCWLCSDILSKYDPYSHFSDPRSKCSQKLWDTLIEEPKIENDETKKEEEEIDINDLMTYIKKDKKKINQS